MPNRIKLNICSIGDPTSPKTWSGTPYNLYSELKELDCLDFAFNSSMKLNRFENVLIKIIMRILYSEKDDLSRSSLLRYINSRHVKDLTKNSESRRTLHTGTLDLPFLIKPVNQEHYLFCDTTWNLWRKFATQKTVFSKTLEIESEKLERKAYEQMQHIFPISEYVKENLINHYHIDERKITVVGTGIGSIKPYYGIKDYSYEQLLFVAKDRFIDKGGILVIEAFKLISKENPKIKLSIVGKNKFTESLNIPNIKVFDFLSQHELQNLFNESSIFVMPAYNEPWGLVYLEALACKMPIIGLNRNSFPEISNNGKFGFILDDADPKLLAKIILENISNHRLLEEMGENGQTFCLDNFSWSKTAKRIVEVIINERNCREKIYSYNKYF